MTPESTRTQTQTTTVKNDADAFAPDATTYLVDADTALSEAVVDAVARETDRDTLSVEPLYRAVDPDALNDLFARRSDGRPRPPARIRISYGGCDVWVDGESVHVRQRS